MYMSKQAIMSRLNEHYEIAQESGEVYGIFLQGSQNYIDDLFSEYSDVDSRAIYVPNTREICLGKNISKPEQILDNGEHIDRFDIRSFVGLLKKPGINNYEAIFSEYYIINEEYKSFHEKLINIREDIVRSNEKQFLMSLMGISRRDKTHLTMRSGGEDYDIDNFGYSRKRLANIIRFNKTLKAYMAGKPFKECLTAMSQDLIHKVRRTPHYTLDEAIKIAEEKDKETYELAQGVKKSQTKQSVMKRLDDFVVEVLTHQMKKGV